MNEENNTDDVKSKDIQEAIDSQSGAGRSHLAGIAALLATDASLPPVEMWSPPKPVVSEAEQARKISAAKEKRARKAAKRARSIRRSKGNEK